MQTEKKLYNRSTLENEQLEKSLKGLSKPLYSYLCVCNPVTVS